MTTPVTMGFVIAGVLVLIDLLHLVPARGIRVVRVCWSLVILLVSLWYRV